ncbi:succinate dehydrogenase, cytochrome b556 subunit [Beggiatoa alba]|nr:succinate dehydrogenase, cytochrome b556 subunit [Beggiatoa alba]
MPVTAVVSILHRVSGILLFLAIPYIIWLFSSSVKSPEGFAYVQTILASGYGKLISIVLLWAITHHFFAGLRFLILDFNLGITRCAAIKLSWLVNLLVAVTFVLLIFKVVL